MSVVFFCARQNSQIRTLKKVLFSRGISKATDLAPNLEDFNHKILRMPFTDRLGNMVAVMANEQQQFESLVSQLMSPDNGIRNQAEVKKYTSFVFLWLPVFIKTK